MAVVLVLIIVRLLLYLLIVVIRSSSTIGTSNIVIRNQSFSPHSASSAPSPSHKSISVVVGALVVLLLLLVMVRCFCRGYHLLFGVAALRGIGGVYVRLHHLSSIINHHHLAQDGCFTFPF